MNIESNACGYEPKNKKINIFQHWFEKPNVEFPKLLTTIPTGRVSLSLIPFNIFVRNLFCQIDFIK